MKKILFKREIHQYCICHSPAIGRCDLYVNGQYKPQYLNNFWIIMMSRNNQAEYEQCKIPGNVLNKCKKRTNSPGI